MLPQDILSTDPIEDNIIGGRALPVRNTIDYVTGGMGLQDPSQGLMVQVWRARIVNNKSEIVVDADSVTPTTLITGTNITEVSLSFDQSMRPVVAYVEDGTPKLYWYDTTIPGQTTTDYPGIITPRVSLDDKRGLQSQISDVIFAYLRNGSLYYRQQRDRYLTEYLLQEDVGSPGLIKIGMNRQLRMQFLLRNPS